jgi:hypothetical protein
VELTKEEIVMNNAQTKTFLLLILNEKLKWFHNTFFIKNHILSSYLR